MGVEYTHLVIPRPVSWRPDPTALSRLIGFLVDAGFIARPSQDHFLTDEELKAHDHWEQPALLFAGDGRSYSLPFPDASSQLQALKDSDYRIVWPAPDPEDSVVKYPFERVPDEPEEQSVDFELHYATDYVYAQAETVGPFKPLFGLRCKCWQKLEYTSTVRYVLEGPRLHASCPRCGRAFDPERLAATVRNGWTNRRRQVRGGATYRFALAISCGKALPSETGEDIALHPDFVSAWNRALNQPFHEVGLMG